MAGRFSYSASDRNSSTPWFRLGNLDVTTTVLVAGLCVVSMVVWAIDSSLLEPFVLDAGDVRRGQVWRLVTWPVVNTPESIWTILTIAIFWYFGRELEGMLGRNRFAWFLGIVTVIPAIVAALVDLNVWGLEYVELAVLLTFIAEFPLARFFFNIPAWVLGAVIVGLQVLVLVGNRDSDGLVFLIVLLATAALAGRSFGLASGLPWLPQIPLPEFISGTRSSGPRRSSKGKVRGKGRNVVDGPWSAPPPPPPARPSPDTAAAQAELDHLLDKISASGLDSLTGDEKRRLNELSKRLR
jgi:membrane associated rhomboid family serine protease